MVINSSLPTANLATSLASLTQPLAQLSLTDSTSTASASDVSSTLDTQFSGISTAQSSVADGVSFTQSQDGLLSNIGKALEAMEQLASSAQNPNATDADRAADNQQFQSLSAYVTQTAGQNYNGTSLFSANPLSVNSDANGDSTTLPGINLSTSTYTNATSADISTLQGPPAGGAVGALSSVQAALKQLSTDRATAGSNLGHLGTIADTLAVSSENLSAVTDFTDPAGAQQATTDASNSILNQSGISLLTQANQLPQSVMDLLNQ